MESGIPDDLVRLQLIDLGDAEPLTRGHDGHLRWRAAGGDGIRRANTWGRTAAATGACVAALAFAVPAVQSFASGVSTPADDSFGCGSISTPAKVLPSGVQARPG